MVGGRHSGGSCRRSEHGPRRPGRRRLRINTDITASQFCIVDRREVEFAEAALLQAVFANPAVAASLSLPPGRPDAIRFLPAANAVEIRYGIGTTRRTVPLAASALAALLLAYCIRARIALPRSAAKSVHVTADAVILKLRLEFDRLPNLDARKPGSKPAESAQSAVSWIDRPVGSG